LDERNEEGLRIVHRSDGEAPPGDDSGARRRRFLRRPKNLAVLPALVTMANCVCGFAAIVQVAALRYDPLTHVIENPENLTHAAWLVLLGMLFDGVDGRVARMTDTAGEFGGELDSLCDVITFGVAPALMVAMLNSSAITPALWWKTSWLFGLAFACGAVLRLARFNVENTPDESSHQSFKGLPSPAAAGAIVTLVLFMRFLQSERSAVAWLPDALVDGIAAAIPYLLPFVAIAGAWLMVSRVRYVHVGNRYLRGRRSPAAIARMVIIAIVFFAILPELALAVVFTGYAASGPVGQLVRRLRGLPEADDGDADALPAQPEPHHATEAERGGDAAGTESAGGAG
jgi:CDP-diacylglycerol--serine O-phosphatidyltransferase